MNFTSKQTFGLSAQPFPFREKNLEASPLEKPRRRPVQFLNIPLCRPSDPIGDLERVTACWTRCLGLIASVVFLSALLKVEPVLGGEPFFETTSLFAAMPSNRPNYRIPALIAAANGDLLVICERRNDGIGDIGNHDIVMKRSSDKGRTWGAEQLIFDDGSRVCTDLTLGIDRETNTLWLFFLRDKKQFHYFTSGDNGSTWNGPVSIHEQVVKPEWDQLRGKAQGDTDAPSKGRVALWEKDWAQRYGCGPGNAMIRLRSGRLLVPARHREDVGGGRLRSFSHCFYSDDHGKTWLLGGSVGVNTSECQVVELNNGDVRVIARNESSEDVPDNLRHLTAISHDGGSTWTGLQRQEELITPRCHGCVERFDSTRLLFSSPASPFRQNEHPYGRYNLTVRLSLDEGQTWSAGRTIWPHPASYSDIAVLDDQSVGIIYERGSKGSTHYWDELQFARFNVEWLSRTQESAK